MRTAALMLQDADDADGYACMIGRLGWAWRFLFGLACLYQ